MTDPREAASERPPTLFTLSQIRHLMRVEFGRAQRYGYPVACLAIVVDQLGDVRDRQGYEAKEEVLARVVERLLAATRGSDAIGRLPDDRLMAVVPHTPPDGVRRLGERLVAEVGALALPELSGARLSVSVGGAWVTGDETLFFDDLMSSAEHYAAEAAAAGGGAFRGGGPRPSL
ncbi:MAG: GGDEF domain-containing protein [Planctomycetes bacterium]|nr:GGDEF domain-containing protein [Planctomycetota bacterium]